MDFTRTVALAERGDLLKMSAAHGDVLPIVAELELRAMSALNRANAQRDIALNDWYQARRAREFTQSKLDAIRDELARRDALGGLEAAFPALVEATSPVAVSEAV